MRSAEMIYDDPKFRGNLQRAYIHKVKPLSLTYARHPHSKQQNNPNIFYFVTYVAAAVDAYNNKLIRLSGLRRIMQEAVNDFQIIDWKISPPAATSQEASSTHTKLTIEPPATSPQTPLRPFPSLSFSSSYRNTPTFPGRIDIFSPQSSSHPPAGSAGAVPVSSASAGSTSLSTTMRTDYFSTRNRNPAPPAAAPASASLSNSDSYSKIKSVFRVVVSCPGHRPYEVFPVSPSIVCGGGRVSDNIKRELRTRELNNDIDLGNEILVRSGLPPVERIPFVARRSIGTMVNTVMGRGPIVSFRATDGMFEVHVPWLKAGNLLIAEAGVGPPRVKVFLPGSCL